MPVSVRMPALGETVTEGTVIRWHKGQGDVVEVDEPLLDVSTDKVDTEIPSPVAGVLVEVLAHENDTVAVGGELARIDTDSRHQADEREPAPQRATTAPTPVLAPADAQSAPPEPGPVKLVISGAPGSRIEVPSAPASSGIGPKGPHNPARQAARILSLAQESADALTKSARAEADKILADVRARAEAILAEARRTADGLQSDAERSHSEMLGTINQQRTVLEGRLEQLRAFEREYRTRLMREYNSIPMELRQRLRLPSVPPAQEGPTTSSSVRANAAQPGSGLPGRTPLRPGARPKKRKR